MNCFNSFVFFCKVDSVQVTRLTTTSIQIKRCVCQIQINFRLILFLDTSKHSDKTQHSEPNMKLALILTSYNFSSSLRKTLFSKLTHNIKPLFALFGYFIFFINPFCLSASECKGPFSYIIRLQPCGDYLNYDVPTTRSSVFSLENRIFLLHKYH